MGATYTPPRMAPGDTRHHMAATRLPSDEELMCRFNRCDDALNRALMARLFKRIVGYLKSALCRWDPLDIDLHDAVEVMFFKIGDRKRAGKEGWTKRRGTSVMT